MLIIKQITSRSVFGLFDSAWTISINTNNAFQNPRYEQTSEGLERADIQVLL
jgi:hypothetical protein